MTAHELVELLGAADDADERDVVIVIDDIGTPVYDITIVDRYDDAFVVRARPRP